MIPAEKPKSITRPNPRPIEAHPECNQALKLAVIPNLSSADKTFKNRKLENWSCHKKVWNIPYKCPASCKLSAIALLSVFSRSKTPHVACNTESKRQSPADLFHKAWSLDPKWTRTSSLQLMIAASSSNSRWASLSSNSEYSCSWVAGGKSSISEVKNSILVNFSRRKYTYF